MWACRSFLRRPSVNLITSRLRSVSRHHPTHTAVPCPNLVSASRRHVSDATNVDRHQPAAAAATKHLYVVLDDHKKDYGIYKLDADADLRDGDINSDSTTTAPRRLPHPAHIRLEVSEEEDSSAQFAAAGSCIVATGCSPFTSLVHSDDCGVVTIQYDIKTAALSVSTHPTDTLHWGYAVAVPVGNRLYVLDLRTSTVDSFHCMTTSRDGDAAAAAVGEVKQRDWSWYDGSGSSRIGWSYGGKARSWSDLLPFDSDNIQGYAVHPRDCTIFLSAPVLDDEERFPPVNTFAYDTTTTGCWEWTHYGNWKLPFKGHARYDRQLNKWVGLQVGEDGDGTTGYICACDVPANNHDEDRSPQWVRSMKKIVLDDPDQRRLDLKLVYMDERAEYCLFERLRRQGANEKDCPVVDGEECVLRLTTFRLKYERGEPGYLTIMDCRARSYKVVRYRDDFEAQAFWL